MSYVETFDDLSKKYHHTYIKINGELGYASNFCDKGTGIQCVWQTADGKETIMTIIKPEDIETLSFDSTFLNCTSPKDTKHIWCPLIHFSRAPKRQWKRGMCAENTWLRCPLVGLYKPYGKKVQWYWQLSFNTLHHLMNPQFPLLKDAVAICPQYQGVALSPMFAITLSNVSDTRFLLASPFGFIGEADATHIWVKHQPAFQEVKDFVARTNQPIHVELETWQA